MTRWIPTLGALTLAGLLAVPAIRHWREQPPPPPPPPEPMRSAWLPPDTAEIGGGGDYVFGLSLAPNGRQLVYPAARSGHVTLWLHDLRSGSTRELPGTEGAVAPFWSPDGGRIGFFTGQRIKSFDIANGQVGDLGEAPAGRGGSWNADGDLLYSPAAGTGLMRRRADGSLAPLTTVAAPHGEIAHTWPSFLPDGRHFVFTVTASQPARAGLWMASLDRPDAARRLLSTDTQALVVGHTLLILTDATLMAQPIDTNTFEPQGRPAPVASNAGRGPLGQLLATATADVLIYGAPLTRLRELRWLDRDGARSAAAGSTAEPVDAWDLRVAPDGRRFVVTEVDRQLRTLDVFVRTPGQPAPVRLSLSIESDDSGVWSPDGLRIAWAGQRRKVMVRGAGAVLPEQTIATFDRPVQVWDWSRDGRSLLIGLSAGDTGDDLWIQPPVEGAKPEPYFVGAFNQSFGSISPDGRTIAYASDEGGQFDVYVDAFPKRGTRTRITTAGATEPRWSSDGRELYFRRGAEIHAVTLNGSDVRSVTRLFDAGAAIRAYDVSRDGRFLVNVPASTNDTKPATLVTHWNNARTEPRNHGATEKQP